MHHNVDNKGRLLCALFSGIGGFDLVSDSDTKRSRIIDLEDELIALKQGQTLPIDNVIVIHCVMSEKDYWGNRVIHRMFTNINDAELLLNKMNEDDNDDYVIEEIKMGE